jgi:hypothetical protein
MGLGVAKSWGHAPHFGRPVNLRTLVFPWIQNPRLPSALRYARISLSWGGRGSFLGEAKVSTVADSYITQSNPAKSGCYLHTARTAHLGNDLMK